MGGDWKAEGLSRKKKRALCSFEGGVVYVPPQSYFIQLYTWIEYSEVGNLRHLSIDVGSR